MCKAKNIHSGSSPLRPPTPSPRAPEVWSHASDSLSLTGILHFYVSWASLPAILEGWGSLRVQRKCCASNRSCNICFFVIRVSVASMLFWYLHFYLDFKFLREENFCLEDTVFPGICYNRLCFKCQELVSCSFNRDLFFFFLSLSSSGKSFLLLCLLIFDILSPADVHL